jgi:hypothetical protein
MERPQTTNEYRCQLADAGICEAAIDDIILPIIIDANWQRQLQSNRPDACPNCGVQRGQPWRNTRGLLRPADAPVYRSVVGGVITIQPLASMVIDYLTVVDFESGDVVDAVDQRSLLCSAVVLYAWTARIYVGSEIRPIRLHLLKYIGWPDRFNTALNDAGIRLYTGDFGRNPITSTNRFLRFSKSDDQLWLFDCDPTFYDQVGIDPSAADFRIVGRPSTTDCLPLLPTQAFQIN